MKSITLLLAILIGTLLLSAPIPAPAGSHDDESSTRPKAAIDKPAPEFTLEDVSAKTRKLADYKGKFVVLEWNNWDCPFVKKHYSSGNMQNLQKTFVGKGVVWLTVCSSAPGKQGYYDADHHRKKIEKTKSAMTDYLLDPDGTVGRLYGAKTTPHIFIINPQGVLIYAGAIDDKPSTKTADLEGATNYVRRVLDEAMAGKTVSVKTSTPYGCSVKYK